MIGKLVKKRRKAGNVFYAALTFDNGERKWINLELICKGNQREAQKRLDDLIQICKSLNHSTILSYTKYSEFRELQKENENPKPCTPYGQEICTSVPALNQYTRSGIDRNILFSDFLYVWYHAYPNMPRKENVDSVTLEGYKEYIDLHIAPYFRAKKIRTTDISREVLNEYYKHKTLFGRVDGKGGLSYNSVRLHRAVINLALQYAVEENLLAHNPNQYAWIPKDNQAPKKMNFYNAEQVAELLELFHDRILGLMILITTYYGLRRSEMNGISWRSIDLVNDTITIQRVVVLKKTIHRKEKTKNKFSNRTYPLLPDIKKKFLQLADIQKHNRERYGEFYFESDEIFVHPNGKPYYPSYSSHEFRKLMKQFVAEGKTKLPIYRWHDLRHSCASILLSLGWSMKDISEWLGHADIQTTMDLYAHVDLARKRALAAQIGNPFKRAV